MSERDSFVALAAGLSRFGELIGRERKAYQGSLDRLVALSEMASSIEDAELREAFAPLIESLAEVKAAAWALSSALGGAHEAAKELATQAAKRGARAEMKSWIRFGDH